MSFLRSCAVAGGGAAGRPAHDARAPARARAGRPATRHRRAASRPALRAATSAGSAGRCSVRSASAKARIALARAARRRSCHSGSSGSAVERGLDGLAHLVERQAFGQRIDRLDQRQLGEAGLVDHAVGMHHLQHAVVERGRAGDVAALADRQQLLEIVLARVEDRSASESPVSSLA